ncbi:hypothetical protein MTO96_046143 [Rhipicephalus appendiculatus]
MATLAAAGAAMSTGPNATMSTPKHSCPEATSLHEPLNGCATLSDFEREQMECHENNEGGDISLHDTDKPASRVEREEDKEGDWQTVLTIRQKKALARAGRKAMAAASGYDSSSQHQGPIKPPPVKKKSRVARLPPLPKDDFKIILRPHQGLPIKDLTAPQVSEAVIMATQRKDCKKRYKQSQQNKKTTMKSPGLPKAPIKESPPRPRWYDTEDTDDDAWPPLRQQEDLQAASPRRQLLRSRQRRSQDKDSDSSNHLPSKLQSTPTGSMQRSATPTRKKDSFNNKVGNFRRLQLDDLGEYR